MIFHYSYTVVYRVSLINIIVSEQHIEFIKIFKINLKKFKLYILYLYNILY